MDIKAEVAELKEELIALRRAFHQHPELGLKEFKTSEKVTAYLEDLGITVSHMAGTGVVGLLQGGKPGRTLMLRADMDALPVKEKTAAAYRSVHDGKMHACGHDGHMAMLLVAAKILARHRADFKGQVKFVFQPNEENMCAGQMVTEGVLENPTVDAACGIHLMSSLASGKIGLSAGAVMAGMHEFKLTLRGRGGHTGFPHQSIDPVIAAANIVQTAQLIQSREMDVLKPTLVVFGRIQGGTAANIIPEKTELEGTIRYLYDVEVLGDDHPCRKFERIVAHVCATHRMDYDLDYAYNHPAVVNDAGMVDLVRSAARAAAAGPDHIVPFVTMVGEDFCEFANRVPSAYYFIGAGDTAKGTDFPHHHACFNIDEEVLDLGVEMHVRCALSFFDRLLE